MLYKQLPKDIGTELVDWAEQKGVDWDDIADPFGDGWDLSLPEWPNPGECPLYDEWCKEHDMGRQELEQTMKVFKNRTAIGLGLDKDIAGYRLFHEKTRRDIGPRGKPKDIQLFLQGMIETLDLLEAQWGYRFHEVSINKPPGG